jgi:hypothetical protein
LKLVGGTIAGTSISGSAYHVESKRIDEEDDPVAEGPGLGELEIDLGV